MVYPTPVSLRKRPAPTTQSLMGKSSLRNTSLKMAKDNVYLPPTSTVSTAEYTTTPAMKRQRLSPSNPVVTDSMDRQQYLSTPPKTPPQAILQKIALKIKIPQKELSQEEERNLKIRVAAAERWKPKLTRPLPCRSETTKAYPLKLMRHYPGHVPSTEKNFIRPKINKSPRVEKILRGFPTLSMKPGIGPTVQSRPPLPAQQKDLDALQANKKITKSEAALKLAWENFASPELGRKDRGREAMLQSGLWTDDLIEETNGRRNTLPEWKQWKTGRFAKGKKAT